MCACVKKKCTLIYSSITQVIATENKLSAIQLYIDVNEGPKNINPISR